jgi:oxygen-independent coproporphyrinogen-3 oxidase
MEGYFEQVVDTLTAAGYRWYETANFCLQEERAAGRDLRARHNLAYWKGRDYLGLGVGAVSTVDGVRRRNRPGLAAYVGALRRGITPPREVELLGDEIRTRERLLLGLRLDERLPVAEVEGAIDNRAMERLAVRGLVELTGDNGRSSLRLTRRGRFLGGGVTAELLGPA